MSVPVWKSALALLCCVALQRSALAEDCDDPDACDGVGEITTELDLEELFFPEASNHPGLLGKNYADIRYQHLSPSNLGWVKQLDDSLQGMIYTGNCPLPALDSLPGPFRYDLFTEFDAKGLNSGNSPGLVSYDAMITSLAFALTGYWERFDHVRPFIQLGATFGRIQDRLTYNHSTLVYDESGAEFYANFGAEVDLLDRLSGRITVLGFGVNGIDTGIGATELIYWPLRRIYLRGGLLINVESVGGLIGAGVTF